MGESIKLCKTWILCVILLLTVVVTASAQFRPSRLSPPNMDKRITMSGRKKAMKPAKTNAMNRLKDKVHSARVDLGGIDGTPAWIGCPDQFLTGPTGKGGSVSDSALGGIPSSDKDRPVKAFLREYAGLFGHDDSVLAGAVNASEFTDHYGVRHVCWRQELEGIPVDSRLLAAISHKGELICLRGSLVADLQAASQAGTPNKDKHLRQPPVTAADAVADAARDLGSDLSASDLQLMEPAAAGPAMCSDFESSALLGKARASLVWFRMDESSLRLCWNVLLSTKSTDGLYQVIVDAITGEVLQRMSLTFYDNSAHAATYAVYQHSPLPLSPGLSSPSTYLPPLVNRSLKTLHSLNPTASPLGWIPDHIAQPSEPFDNMLVAGHNVVAYSYPMNFWYTGDPYRIFNPTVELTSTGAFTSLNDNWQPGAVNTFYWANVMHDRLWDSGFSGDMAYGYVPGNIPYDMYHRPDPVYVITRACEPGESSHAQSTRYNGTSPEIHLACVPVTGGYQDEALDSETLIHEYQHLVTARIIRREYSETEFPDIMPGYDRPMLSIHEGMSDFMALTIPSHPYDDNPNGNYGGCYAFGAFSAIQFAGVDGFNNAPYYFGIRRLPYSTDVAKNPLTAADIDDETFDLGDVPYNTYWNTLDMWWNTEPHNAGELWCSFLWDLRAKIIQKTGDDNNDDIIGLVTRSIYFMSPGFTDLATARDALLLTDTAYFGGKYRQEIWEAFAGRGLGENGECSFGFQADDEYSWEVVVEDYTIGADPGTTNQVATPEFAPVGGWYEGAQNVAITCDTPGATIRYTTDGTDPTTGSTVYSGTPIPVTSTTVLKAEAWYGTDSPSRVRENLYTIRPSIPWQRTDGAHVTLRGVVSAVFTVGSQKWIYIQHPDRIWGVRVVADLAIPASLYWTMDVQGTVQTDLENGEKYILADAGYPVRYGTTGAFVVPLCMRNQWLGGDANDLAPSINEAYGFYNVGLLVQSWGEVKYVNPDMGMFVIDDGSMLTDPLGIGYGGGHGVRVNLPTGVTMPTVGSYLRVRGISSTTKATPNGNGSYYVRMLRPRNAFDIQAISPSSWHTMEIPLNCEQWNYFSLPGIPRHPEPWYMMPPCSTGGSVWLGNNIYRWDAVYDYWTNYGDGCQYLAFGNFLVGDGYKFFHGNPGDPTFTCASCFTFEHADVTGDQFISLPNGSLSLPTTTSHSLIGNPFHTSRAWANMKVTDGRTVKTLPQAVTDGWIHAVKVWDGTTLLNVDVSTGSMDTLKAYEIYPKYDNMALIIPSS